MLGAPHPGTPSRAPAGGYSLIELALVITLLGIITSVAIWRTGPALERARVRSAASILAADLQYAQMIAAQLRQPVVVIFTPGLNMYLVRDRAGGTVFRERFMGTDTEYQVQTLSAIPSAVEIFPNGVATETLTASLDINGFTRQVKLSRAGQIRVLAP